MQKRFKKKGGIVRSNSDTDLKEAVHKFVTNANEQRFSEFEHIVIIKYTGSQSLFVQTDIYHFDKPVTSLIKKMPKYRNETQQQAIKAEALTQMKLFETSYREYGGQSICPAIVYVDMEHNDIYMEMIGDEYKTFSFYYDEYFVKQNIDKITMSEVLIIYISCFIELYVVFKILHKDYHRENFLLSLTEFNYFGEKVRGRPIVIDFGYIEEVTKETSYPIENEDIIEYLTKMVGTEDIHRVYQFEYYMNELNMKSTYMTQQVVMYLEKRKKQTEVNRANFSAKVEHEFLPKIQEHNRILFDQIEKSLQEQQDKPTIQTKFPTYFKKKDEQKMP